MWVFELGELDMDREKISDTVKKRDSKLWRDLVPVFSDEAIEEVEDAGLRVRFWGPMLVIDQQ